MSKAGPPHTTGAEDSRVTPLTSPDPDALALFRALARSGDSLFLAEGPPHPDAELLQIAVDALEADRKCRQALKAQLAAFRETSPALWEATRPLVAEATRLMKRKKTDVVKRAAKHRATTPAGLYAKAQVVRLIVGMERGVAASLAADILDNPAIRAVLWPAETDV